jgi:hypothetical protein
MDVCQRGGVRLGADAGSGPPRTHDAMHADCGALEPSVRRGAAAVPQHLVLATKSDQDATF